MYKTLSRYGTEGVPEIKYLQVCSIAVVAEDGIEYSLW